MKLDLSLSILSFALYIIGGVGIFSGLLLLLAMKGQNILNLGSAESIAYLLLCVGGCMSAAGVLMLRVVRNRTDQMIRKSCSTNP